MTGTAISFLLLSCAHDIFLIVKTLAIRGTAEEFMVTRRDALKRGLGNNSGKLPNLTDDRTMRDFIAVCAFFCYATSVAHSRWPRIRRSCRRLRRDLRHSIFRFFPDVKG